MERFSISPENTSVKEVFLVQFFSRQ